MIGENPGPGLAVMMLAVAAAAVIHQVSHNLLSVITHLSPICFVCIPGLLTLYGLTVCVLFYWVQDCRCCSNT